MAYATTVAVSKGALVAPSEIFDKRNTTIFSRQLRTPSSFKYARQGYSPLSVKCFKGMVIPKPGLLDNVTNGLPSVITKPDHVRRKDFPADFLFGCSTSALQTEGTGTEGGRGPSTWDQFIRDENGQEVPAVDSYNLFKEDVKDLKKMGVNAYRFSIGWPSTWDQFIRDENGQEVPAVDSYNLFKEDVKDLKKMGVNAYRFSIGWPRILPDGTLKGGVNQEGIQFYNNFIDELLKNGITPVVTLTHFDLPQALQDKYKGFLSSNIVEDFKDYADVCFKNFGDRVKHWSTINEPQVFAQFGYVVNLPKDHQALPTDPFVAAHHIILSHAAAAKLYKEKYQKSQNGDISISLVTQWFKPHSDSKHDKDASERAFDFLTGWFLEPLINGDYPFIMKALVKEGLPEFTEEEKAMVKGSFDFIGINYYTSRFAKHIPFDPDTVYETAADYQHAELTLENNEGQLIGEKAPGSEEIYVYPEGLRDALVYISKEYGNPKMYITENGYPEKRDDNLSVQEALKDDGRIEHIMNHLSAVKQAMKEGADVNGYFMWALMDCMEMGSHYNVRFGLYYTDYLNDFARIPKKSAKWMKSFMK